MILEEIWVSLSTDYSNSLLVDTAALYSHVAPLGLVCSAISKIL